jgi:DNA-binding CsgD family transcriptional regulator
MEALAAGQWSDAAAALTAVADVLPGGDVRRGEVWGRLSEALWWLGQVDDALTARERAYAAFRAQGEDAAAARAAAWLAREYAAAVGNAAASQGWLARAETLAQQAGSGSVGGWVALTRALLADDPQSQAAAAESALAAARATCDGDLEMLALGRLGLARVAGGRIDEGLGHLDEAMAAATGGEVGLSTLAALCCDLVVASELSGEIERFAQWQEVIGSLVERHGHPPLLAFCATCCAEAFMAGGDWPGAERELRAAVEALRSTGHRPRCLAPAAKLAEVLVSQGRLEEAERTLAGDDSDESLLVRARLALARGDTDPAVILAERHARRYGDVSLRTVPAVALQVEAHLAAGDLAGAQGAADRLRAVASATGHRRTLGLACLARGQVAAASGQTAAAVRAALEEALDHLSSVAPGAVQTAQAHLELARVYAADTPQLAAVEAKAAIAGFETAGAAHQVDAAAALLRSLGDRTRVGPKHTGMLTQREKQVLRLVAQGLTNAEVAERLFISPKTAGNHVSSILAKLGLRSRVEAAADAALHLSD